MKAPVLAFLQNMWFPVGTPETIIGRYLADQSYRRRVLGNCMTGRRLRTAFGEKYNEIWWENASQQRAEKPNGRFPADLQHMTSVIIDVKPKAIVCLGAISSAGLHEINNTLWGQEAYEEGPVLPHHFFMHPNARGVTQLQLNEFASKIIEKYF